MKLPTKTDFNHKDYKTKSGFTVQALLCCLVYITTAGNTFN